jgi:thiosulfate/3-mercaptopyruvate sulfurtransferase
MNWTTLVSAEALAAALGDPALRLVDARFTLAGADAGPDVGENAWRAAHLPGAGYAHLDRDLSDHRKPASEGRHPLPEAADFCAVLQRLGISPGDQVVVYDGADGAMAAARFWWLLRLLGHQRVAVLDGGFARWQQLGLPLETVAPEVFPGQYDGQFDLRQIATAEEVLRRQGEAPGWLLDARAPERFRGEVEPLDRRAGHIPGALNRPYAQNLELGRMRPAEALREEFGRLLGQHTPDEVLLQCGSGVTACHNLLAMEHAGLHGARIYAGSWSGWVSDPARPVATGET